MRAIVLNGIDKEYSNLIFAYDILLQELKKVGWKSDSYFLYEKEIESCKGCFGCWIKTPGLCVTNDGTELLLKNIINSDILILLTNVVFGGYSSQLKKVLDRLLPLINPFFEMKDKQTIHSMRYRKYPSIAGIGVMTYPNEEGEQIFRELVKRNSVHLFAPRSGSIILFSGQMVEKNRDKINYILQLVGT